jgi:hypothetical protein
MLTGIAQQPVIFGFLDIEVRADVGQFKHGTTVEWFAVGRDAALRRPRPPVLRSGTAEGGRIAGGTSGDVESVDKSFAPLHAARTAQRTVPTFWFFENMIPEKSWS